MGRLQLDAGQPITALAGVHLGCYELFAHEPVRTISDLKGKTGRHPSSSARAAICSSRSWRPMSGSIPHEDIDWVASPTATPWSCSPNGKVDAFLGFPPEPQELRARKIGRVILNTTTDKPWSQYFCCMVFGNREFVRDHPVATKRFLRALSRPPTSAPPSRSGPRSVWSISGSRERYDYALQTLTELPYDRVARVRPRGHACASTRCGSTRSA